MEQNHPETFNIHAFLEKYQIKTTNGVPFDFYDRPFMWDIFEDLSPRKCILKAPQVGASEMEIVTMLWVAKYLHKDIIYTLPTGSDINDFVPAKVNRIIAQNPIFQEWIKEEDKNSVNQKGIGHNRIYFRGTWTSKSATMVSSQLNIHDEIDASNQAVIAQYETRQQAQAGGWKWTFSHPSTVGNGIDKEWQVSDKKEWYITCPHCNDEHFMTFPSSIDSKKACFICKKCKKPIDDDVRRNGKWKATAQGNVSGYHISQLMCPWITAEKILKDFNEKDTQYFYNFVLALPYADPANQVTWEVIKKNTQEESKPDGRMIFGVDTGLDIRYIGGDLGGMRVYGQTKTYEDLERVTLLRYPNSIIMADQGGDLIGIRLLQQKYPGRVYLCYFQQDRKAMQLIRWGEKEEFGIVRIDRNRAIQLVVDEINSNRYIFVGEGNYWYDYFLHWASMYRMTEFDSMNNKTFVWERNGRNDWAIAHVYWRVGIDRFAEYVSDFIGGETNSFYNEVPVAPVAIHNNKLLYSEDVDIL